MKLIIDIDDNEYTEIKEDAEIFRNKDISVPHLYKVIESGTPLPKEHGRLFILDEEKAKNFFTKFSFSLQDWISEVGISNATIKVIEADNVESEEK